MFFPINCNLIIEIEINKFIFKTNNINSCLVIIKKQKIDNIKNRSLLIQIKNDLNHIRQLILLSFDITEFNDWSLFLYFTIQFSNHI